MVTQQITDTKTGEKVTIGKSMSRKLLGQVIDDVFDGAIEDASVIEEIYASIKSHELDEEIDRIIADDTPVTNDDKSRIMQLQFEVGIANGKNRMMVEALVPSLIIMRAYKVMGYGDEVYMDALCGAIRHVERVLMHFALPAPSSNEQEDGR